MYVTNGNGNVVQMFSRNISNGQISPLSPASISCGIGPYGIDMSDDGKTIYVASGGSNYVKIFSRDATTGLLSSLTVSTKFSSSVDDVSVAPDGKSVYSTNAATLSQFSRDAGVSLGAYTKSTTGLTTGTTYYYRGYATNSKGTSYSPDGTFTTL